MRLWLVSVFLFAFSLAQRFSDRNHQEYPYKQWRFKSFPDGTLMTFYFLHKGNGHKEWNTDDHPEEVVLNFYSHLRLPYSNGNIAAHISADRARSKAWFNSDHCPVISDSNIVYKWNGQTKKCQVVDRVTPSNGHWKIEVYKHSDTCVTVFFEDYWNGLHCFKDWRTATPLAEVFSVMLFSHNVELDTVDFRMSHSARPLSVEKWYDAIWNFGESKYVTFSEWPIGGYIEMTVVMRASDEGVKDRFPSIIFAAEYGGPTFLKIVQMFNDYSRNGQVGWHETWLTSNEIPQSAVKYAHNVKMVWTTEPSKEDLKDKCYGSTKVEVGPGDKSEKHNGDIQHLRLERIGQHTVKMQMLYKYPNGYPGIECIRTIPEALAGYMEYPFDIITRDAAVILHLSGSLK